jgi:hypothetical protein
MATESTGGDLMKPYRSKKTVMAAKCMPGNKRKLAELGKRSLDGIEFGEWLVVDPYLKFSNVMDDVDFHATYGVDLAPRVAELEELLAYVLEQDLKFALFPAQFTMRLKAAMQEVKHG